MLKLLNTGAKIEPWHLSHTSPHDLYNYIEVFRGGRGLPRENFDFSDQIMSNLRQKMYNK